MKHLHIPGPPRIVFADDASTPADGSANQTGTNLIVPYLTTPQPGDFAYTAVEGSPLASGATIPSGWSLIIDPINQAVANGVYKRTSTGSDASSYTWTVTGISNVSRSAVTVHVRNGIQESLQSHSNTAPTGTDLPMPAFTITKPGSTILCFSGCAGFINPSTESITADSPLTMLDTHKSDGSGTYQFVMHTAVSYEENIAVGSYALGDRGHTQVGLESANLWTAVIVIGAI